MAADDTPNQETEDQWILLVDPAWTPESDDARPPEEAVVGGWFVPADGTAQRFEPNPNYEPSSEDSATDPVDATLRLVVQGQAEGDALLATLRDAVLSIAVDEQGEAIVVPSPDDVPSVLAVTAPAHSARLDVPNFREVSTRELAEALPDEGVDVLLNPGAPSSMRLLASALKEAAGPAAAPAPEPPFRAEP
ncbi:hypothetical protein GCM10027271_03400 [Saccharopolyspora gloriosae]|uniref:Type VII secretion system-associated protein n=1 Tax=Saccharopolyspora gloriosae TaxID=455344 RepID=A0A840NJ44_9PSEU|nr:type VII secretion system-associated protein [Saccharopolyspora gloriosae]MBB5071890.1 hypothetical protein [Saccharopolyspora gloriosae]